MPRRRPISRVTMTDVAAAAGVSQATVSRAISGDPRVTAETRDLILAAASRLGYVINRAARVLAGSSTNSIGFVIAEQDVHVWGNPYIPRILAGIESVLAELDQQLVLFVAQTVRDQQRLINYVEQGKFVDGFLIITDNRSDQFLGYLLKEQIPVVVGGRPIGFSSATWVDVDNVAGARDATTHLFDAGCHRIGLISGPQSTSAGRDRVFGYRQVQLERAAADYDAVWCADDWGTEAGYRGTLQLLDRFPDLDGLFAAGELLAFGALSALRSRNVRVPEDVRIVGFDDSPACARADPPLSCVAQPVEELGLQMATLLLEQIRGDGRPRHLVLDTQLKIRSSSGLVDQRDHRSEPLLPRSPTARG